MDPLDALTAEVDERFRSGYALPGVPPLEPFSPFDGLTDSVHRLMAERDALVSALHRVVDQRDRARRLFADSDAAIDHHERETEDIAISEADIRLWRTHRRIAARAKAAS